MPRWRDYKSRRRWRAAARWRSHDNRRLGVRLVRRVEVHETEMRLAVHKFEVVNREPVRRNTALSRYPFDDIAFESVSGQQVYL